MSSARTLPHAGSLAPSFMDLPEHLMSDTWQEVRLGDIISVKHGFAFSGDYFVDTPSLDVLVTPGNFAIGGGFKLDKPKYYRGPVPLEFVLAPGDLIVTMTDLSKGTDTLGYGAVVPHKAGIRFLHNQRIGKITVRRRDLVSVEFLRWVLRTQPYRHEIIASASGSTVKHTSPSRVEAYRFRLPSLMEQRAIGQILSALDDKIELNRQTSETLEAMARALFKSWFVDFDPVHAKAEGRTPSGMDAKTAVHFPSAITDSELGKTPQGWEIGKLGDVLELKRGYDLPSNQRRQGRIPIVSSSGMSGTHDEAKVRAPGIVTGRYGTIGQVFYIREDFWPLNTTLYVRDLKGTNPIYAYHLLRLLDFQKFSDKAAVPGINRNHLHEEPMVMPPHAIQDRFGQIAGSFLDQTDMLTREAETLAALRDALLPRLLSGELPIRHAERFVEAHL